MISHDQKHPIEREQLDADVVIVGGGPAGLACAIRLAQRINNQPYREKCINPDGILVLEKASELGGHSLSGAVMDPRGLRELIPGLTGLPSGMDCLVNGEALFHLSQHSQRKFPFIPKPMRNRGNWIISLGQLVRWLGQHAEQLGVNLLTGVAGKDLQIKGQQVVGLITDDKGVDRNHHAKSNFEPGLKLNAKVTVLAEGARGSLSQQLISHFHLDKGCNPPAYALGIKELWQIKPGRLPSGTVWHTTGFPLTGHVQGGGWLYVLPDQRLSLGLIIDLNYADSRLDLHQMLQQFKTHTMIRRILDGGEFLHYGAKTLSQGGYWSLPKAQVDGALIIGDGAGLVDTLRLKGIHLAIKSGIIAADTIFNTLCHDTYEPNGLAGYQAELANSWVQRDLWRARNHHQALTKGLAKGLFHLLAQQITGGRGLHARYSSTPAHTGFAKLTSDNSSLPSLNPDDKITFAKAHSVYHSGTHHETNQPNHIKLSQPSLCATQCFEEYGNPCQHFCPAGVFELVKSEKEPRLKLNQANCLHCKTCEILDPYEIVTWQPPEGGDGPQYEGM